ncbi:MAG: bifunctional phosphoribosylaminoimidazolecarboxamide formyltransferase/IMP cyclohydrolase PurH, partial [Candidatus Marinimicrobia bacterium]|nr:bifunctional phosphoribosylaminoimidazolecarboxamide formyltransferase/IMP cyclohydrolase PurH [Candidatus Neomarinimicrobiota bacterium]
MEMIKLKRALISVSDKTGIVDFAAALERQDCEIISTGGTKKVLEEAGIAVTDIASVTGNPEAFGGRMKTISFQIESALLFDREKDSIKASELGIEPIDIVVCNLYPFAKVKAQGADLSALIENIDIGGPTM